jgi:hypothetical protein
MVTKKNRIHKKQKRKHNKRQTQKKRRGGKNPNLINWEKGEWSKDPILTKFMTSPNTCEYGLSRIYHYLDENKEKQRKALMILTKSKNEIKESENYRDCKLPEKKVLDTLKKNSDLEKEIDNKKKVIETQIQNEIEKNKKINEELKKLQENKKPIKK